MKFHWQSGRQGGGYRKLKLFELRWPIASDVYLIKFPTNSFIVQHRDVVPGKRHFRFNIILKHGQGGEFRCEESAILWQWWRFVLFRPDLGLHEVDRISKSTRWVLSLGWLRGIK